MTAKLTAFAAAALAVACMTTAQAPNPKHGGILNIYHRETPPSLSIHEEATFSVNIPAMAIFNNLIVYDQHIRKTAWTPSCRSWRRAGPGTSADTALTFKLRRGVKWHDGKPFTANDVKCTFDLFAGQVAGQVPQEPAQGLVRQS